MLRPCPYTTSVVGSNTNEKADPDVKKCQTFASTVKHSHFDIHRLERFSKWQLAKVAIVKCMHYKRVLKSGISNDTSTRPNAETNVEKLGEAEREIFKAVQIHSFTEEVELLTRSTRIVNELKLKQTSVLYNLDPYVDDYGLLRVGGRIDKCNLPHDVKHPVILPKVGHLTTLIVRHFHEKTSHQGRGITANEIRASGIWIVACRAVVSGYIRRCVICRRFKLCLHERLLAYLSPDTVTGDDGRHQNRCRGGCRLKWNMSQCLVRSDTVIYEAANQRPVDELVLTFHLVYRHSSVCQLTAGLYLGHLRTPHH